MPEPILIEPDAASAEARGWLALRNCRLSGHVLPLVLLHPRYGIAVQGGPEDAPRLVQERLDRACFPAIFPGHLPIARLAHEDDPPEAAFAGLKPLFLPGEDAWIKTVRRTLEREGPQGERVALPRRPARQHARRRRLMLVASLAAVLVGGFGVGLLATMPHNPSFASLLPIGRGGR
ncbi:hypothetical protein JMJ55_07470 [Belnapia sp. T6]|uniref:Uncharacterized protein n=1 Tax=Belnapia mucosa TaxID=2804532 RepID=A0ABS1V0C7_9PROT|nr:hypothetical protein [Belnapia mucosa]MBL6455159.1 hypothetical protein [Belnapia mucosa]